MPAPPLQQRPAYNQSVPSYEDLFRHHLYLFALCGAGVLSEAEPHQDLALLQNANGNRCNTLHSLPADAATIRHIVRNTSARLGFPRIPYHL